MNKNIFFMNYLKSCEYWGKKRTFIPTKNEINNIINVKYKKSYDFYNSNSMYNKITSSFESI